MFARRQFEQGDALSHRTLRVRHVTQLRSFGIEVPDGLGGAVLGLSALAFFSGEPGTPTPSPPELPEPAPEYDMAGI